MHVCFQKRKIQSNNTRVKRLKSKQNKLKTNDLKLMCNVSNFETSIILVVNCQLNTFKYYNNNEKLYYKIIHDFHLQTGYGSRN